MTFRDTQLTHAHGAGALADAHMPADRREAPQAALASARQKVAELIGQADPAAHGALQGLLGNVDTFIRVQQGDERMGSSRGRGDALAQVELGTISDISREHGNKPGVTDAMRAILGLRIHAFAPASGAAERTA